MKLKKRVLITAKIVVKGDDEPISKAMSTEVALALPNSKPETIMSGLKEYIDQHWSRNPHEILRVISTKESGELYAVVD